MGLLKFGLRGICVSSVQTLAKLMSNGFDLDQDQRGFAWMKCALLLAAQTPSVPE